MQVNKLFNQMWIKYEELEKMELMKWISTLRSSEPKNLDYNYVFLEVLNLIDFDNDREHEEPEVIKLCTDVIKEKNQYKAIYIAKAYTYRGEMKYYGIDRRKDFNEARFILKDLNDKNGEKKFLLRMIEDAYSFNIRPYLTLDPRNFRNQI